MLSEIQENVYKVWNLFLGIVFMDQGKATD